MREQAEGNAVNTANDVLQGRDGRSLGHVAYDAYRDATGGKSAISGATLPHFSNTNEKVQAGWHAAAYAVRSHVMGDPTERRAEDQDAAVETAFESGLLPEADRRDATVEGAAVESADAAVNEGGDGSSRITEGG